MKEETFSKKYHKEIEDIDFILRNHIDGKRNNSNIEEARKKLKEFVERLDKGLMPKGEEMKQSLKEVEKKLNEKAKS